MARTSPGKDGHGQVRAAIRNAPCGGIHLADPGPDHPNPDGSSPDGEDADDAGLQIPLGDAAVPVCGGQPCPPRLTHIRLSVAETAQLTRLAAQAAAGLITRARLAFALRWLVRPPTAPQAVARWHHHSARLLAVVGTG